MAKVTASSNSLIQKIDQLQQLVKALNNVENIHDKLEILNEQPAVKEFLSHPSSLRTYLSGLTPECDLVIKSILAIGEGPIVFRGMEDMENKFEALREMIKTLLAVEKFYDVIGGIVGYHLLVLKLLAHKDEDVGETFYKESYEKPEGLDLTQDSPEVRLNVRAGIEHLGNLGEIYPVGGAGDRLHLVDEKTGEPLPAAELSFLGKTLLEALIRDLQAREYVHYKLCGKQLLTPIAMMTSHEKNNHFHILTICQQHGWFARPEDSFKFFTQPLVPVITIEGHWTMSGPLQLMLKPGGHGVIWKLAKDSGVFEWMGDHRRTKALVRQINNPVAGTDQGLLAFIGKGVLEKKEFGFASCHRVLNTAEGMNVLILKETKEGIEYRISNIEYTDFAQKNIQDIPVEPGGKYSIYPANTNILFIDLEAIKRVTDICPMPGMLINMKNKVVFIDANGKKKEVEAGRLESTMQNIADFIVDKHSMHIPKGKLDRLKTFVTYNERRKTISVTKKSYAPGMALIETPEGCFYEILQNNHELLTRYCGMKLPAVGSEENYLKEGPTSIVIYHPGLGPPYQVIAQKIQGGRLAERAEMQLEIAELELVDLDLQGSLLITAESILGHENLDNKSFKYSENTGKCSLQNVKVVNKGIDLTANNHYWKNQIKRQESLSIVLEGNGEFFAQNITFKGNKRIVVPDGYRMTASEKDGEIRLELEKIEKPTWYWKYAFDSENRIKLSKG